MASPFGGGCDPEVSGKEKEEGGVLTGFSDLITKYG